MTTLPGSCLLAILLELGSLYEGYLKPIYEHEEELIKLLEMSDTTIPQHYIANTCNTSDLQDTLEWLIKETQIHFFNRSGERYAAQVPEWITKNPQQVIEAAPNIIHTLGNGKTPKNSDDNSPETCIAVLGSTQSTMKKRLGNLKDMIDNKMLSSESEVYLLTGFRKLFPNEISNQEKELMESIYKTELTESHVMDYLYKNTFNKSALLINANPCNLPSGSNKPCSRSRANTEDTIKAFLDTKHNCHNVIFISSAPDIAPQEAAITPIMNNKNHISFEVVGPESHFHYHLMSDQELSKSIHQRLMPLAGTLFGSFEILSTNIAKTNNECALTHEELTKKKLNLLK